MSELTTHTQDNFRALCARADVALRSAARRLRELPSEVRGQTGAEYMGILLIVSLIIAALFTLDIHHLIANAAADLVKDIAHHKDDGGETGGG
jgi:hypothetical protein